MTPNPKFYLVHEETGQRYPIAEGELTLGRSSGELLFPQDESLAPAHCRLVLNSNGLVCLDLAGGVRINDKDVGPGQRASLTVGDRLSLGAQHFVLADVTRGRPPEIRPRSVRVRGTARAYLGVALVATLAIGVLMWGREPSLTLAQVDAELDDVFARYRALGSTEAERADVARRLRENVIPDLVAAEKRLKRVRTADDAEAQYVAVKRRLVAALVRQTRLIAEDDVARAPASGSELERATEDVRSLSAEARRLRPARAR